MRKAFTLIAFISYCICSNAVCAQSWQWSAGCVGGTEATVVATDVWGNVYGAGYTNVAFDTLIFGTTTLTAGLKTSSVIVVKYDGNGKLMWANSVQNGFSRPLAISTDPTGNLYLYGYYTSPAINVGTYTLNKPATDSELFLAKYSPSGSVVWAKNLCSGTVYGGISVKGANLFISGSYKNATVSIGPYTLSNSDPTGSTFDMFIAKLDTSGNAIWAKSIGGNDDDFNYGFTVSNSGNIYISGIFGSSTISFGSGATLASSVPSYFIAKYDSLGSVSWARIAGGKGFFQTSLAADIFENVYIVGTIYKTTFTFGSYILTTDTFTNVFLAKYDVNGTPMWAKEITGNYNIFGYGSVTDVCGNIWITGSMPRGDTGFVVVEGNTLKTPNGQRDPMFMAEWNSGGTYMTSTTLPTGGDDVSSIATDGIGNIYLCDDYWGGPYTIAGTTFNEPKSINEDIFIAKYIPGKLDTTKVNKLVCMSDSAVLQAPAGYPSYMWEDGSIAPTRTVDSPGVYRLYCTGVCSNSILNDNFTVNYGHLDTTSQHTDTSICLHSSLVLVAPAGYTPYYWYDGDTAQKDTVNTPGNYLVACSGTCMVPTLLDTFNVVYNNIDLGFSLGDDTSVCTAYELQVPVTGVSCLWEDGTTGNTDVAYTPGLYYATISRQGCFNSDSVNIDYPNLAQNLHDTIVCKEQPIQITLKANVPRGAGVLWSTGSHEPAITVSVAGRYWVSVTDAACVGSDTMSLGDKFCYCTAFVPDAFTPNGDGVNDYFHPVLDNRCDIFDYTFCIYNRWGQLIFTTHDIYAKWDGRFNHVPQDMGVYMYFVEYRAGGIYYMHSYKGDVTLVR